MKRNSIVNVLCACILFSLSTFIAVEAQTLPGGSNTYLPEFPYAQGWLGADDAYSVPLTATRSLWLFGDTFVADSSITLRSKYKAMVRNSIGFTDCEVGKPCRVTYLWGGQKTEKPRSFFDSNREDLWYWPLDGFRDGNVLYLSLMIVQNKAGAGPEDPFGFEITGTRWVVINNVFDNPEKWQVAQKDITDGKLWAGVSMVEDKGFVLLYSQRHQADGKGSMCVQRVPLANMANPSQHWEYLAKDKKWRKGSPKEDALVVIDQAISEMTVRYHAPSKKWLAVSVGPGFPSKVAVVRTSNSPIGPWSAPETILEFPEMKGTYKSYDKDTFCYAAKEHIEFSNSKIVMTYACNSFSLPSTIQNMDIYRPLVVEIRQP